jgi:hypothetical protein
MSADCFFVGLGSNNLNLRPSLEGEFCLPQINRNDHKSTEITLDSGEASIYVADFSQISQLSFFMI